LIAGEGVPADVARGVTLLDQACEYGQGDACDDLARRAEAGDGMKKDHGKSIGYLAAGCIAEEFQITTCSAIVDAAGKKDKDAKRFLDDWKKNCKATKDAIACAGVERTKKKK
jgi:TPR repeat protein